ncbi:MAG: nucleotidyltransferase [Bacteroidota bacterium]|nr:nucleotidyltransferase [Bacteroidota bacterium]
MGNIFNNDFQEFITALNENNVSYMLVGGYSVILYGHSRTTGDMDVWVKKSQENYKSLVRAFAQFRMPVFDMTEQNFLSNPDYDVFIFGKPPVSIEILTNVKGLEFEVTFPNSALRDVEGLQVRVIGYEDLLKAKRSAGRNKDIDDIENLS